MTSPDEVSRGHGKDHRTEAISAVVQEMGGSRLRILGDLMDSRKRAEAQEQEFLRTIHSENAAFSQIVSMFETHVRELQVTMDSRIKGCSTQISSLQSELVPIIKSDFSTQLSTSIASLRSELDSITAESARSGRNHIILETKLSESVSSTSKSFGEVSSRIEGVTSRMSAIECEVAQTSRDMTEARSDSERSIETLSARITSLEKEWPQQLESRISSRFSEFQNSVLSECRSEFTSNISDLRESFQSKLDQLEHRFVSSLAELPSISALEDRFTSALSAQDEKFSKLIQAMEQKIEGGLTDPSYMTTMTNRISQLECQNSEMDAKYPEIFISEINSRISPIESQLALISNSVASKLTEQDTLLRSAVSAGHYHDWHVDPTTMKSAAKYVSSDWFSIGPYPNMQLRLFPETSTVWLIHRPEGDLPLPVFVDLSIGRSKRAMCRVKKTAELFGHWIWEADGFGKLDDSEIIVVSAEISMRQWMLEAPDTSSQVSSGGFTFLPPPPSTNPFENLNNDSTTGSTTPRRESWAKFGPPNDASPRNPFRH